MRDETLVPGDIPEEDSIGANASTVVPSDEFSEDVLIRILSTGGVPGPGLICGVADKEVDRAFEFIAHQPLEEARGELFAPVRRVAHRIEIDANGEAAIKGFLVHAGAAILDAFEVATDGAVVVNVQQEGFGVIGTLVFKAASDLDTRRDEVEKCLEVVWLAPTGSVLGERLTEERRVEARFVSQPDLTRKNDLVFELDDGGTRRTFHRRNAC